MFALLYSCLAIGCAADIQPKLHESPVKDPALGDPEHNLSDADFREIVLVVRKTYAHGGGPHWITPRLVRVVSSDTVEVYIRNSYLDAGTNYVELRRSNGQWNITKTYIEQMGPIVE